MNVNSPFFLWQKAIFCLSLVFGLGAIPVNAANVQPLDRVIAIVEDDIVMHSEILARVTQVSQRLRDQNTQTPPADLLQKRVLDQLIMESIQLQMAARAGIRVSDSQLNQTMQSIAQRNKMSLDDFQTALTEEGVTYQDAREQIRREMLISRVQQRQVDSRVRVTDKEIQDYLDSEAGKQRSQANYRIGHILVAVAASDGVDGLKNARAKAKQLHDELKQGADFKQLAVAHSNSGTALQGGDLGWRRTDEIPTLFATAAPNLQIGEVAKPIETSGGVHLIKLIDKKGGKTQIVSQARIRHILVQPNTLRTNEEAQALIKQLHQKVLQGEAFDELARAYSDDPASGSNGGDLGWVSPGTMVPEFEKVADQTAINDISEPFRSSFGWHILQVLERRDTDIGEELQASQARQILHRRKFEEELQFWLGEIRDEAFIQIKDESQAKDETGNASISP